MKRILILLLMIVISLSFVYSLNYNNYPIAELGGCKSQQDCEAYCDVPDNMENCINFAEKNNLMTPEEIAEARKVIPFMKSGTTPGKCKSQEECEAYCNDDANLNECIDFAVKAGMISQEEAEMVKKTGGKGPGNCKKEECKTYCEDESHIDECIDFAVKNGLMPAEEAEMAKKTKGKGPGGCKGKEECDAFCNNEANFATCVDFAVQYGMMDAKDAEMAKRTGGKGPGNCKSKEECDAFCNNPDNMETCSNFAIEHGLVSEEEAARMKKNMEWMKSSEGVCFSDCMKQAGVDSKSCGENGAGPEACRTCAESCFPHNNGNCMQEEQWRQKDEECKAKGSGYHLQEVRGSDGQGGECVIDEECVYSSDQMWESQEEKDRKLAEMEAQWAKEREEYEAAHSPGGSENPQEYTGGCTQPGPEGQCNPGPGAGEQTAQTQQTTQTEQVQQQPGGGSGGETPGGTTSGEGGVGSGGSSGGEPGGDSSSGDSGGGGGDASATGAVVKENPGIGMGRIVAELFDFLF